jgi:hypothetical protein
LRKVCHLLDVSPGYLADVKKRVEVNRDPAGQDTDVGSSEAD